MNEELAAVEATIREDGPRGFFVIVTASQAPSSSEPGDPHGVARRQAARYAAERRRRLASLRFVRRAARAGESVLLYRGMVA